MDEIRKTTVNDVDWLMSVCEIAYADGTFDEADCRRYWASIIQNEDCLVMRGERAAMGFAVIGLPYYQAFKIGVTLPICSLGGGARELFKMTEKGISWAKDRGAHYCDFAAVTGKDLGTLARHFGGKPISPAYRVEFNHV